MFKENKKIISIWYIAAFSVIAIGAIIGSVYYAYNFNSDASVKNHLDIYLNSLRQGMNFKSIIASSFKSYALLYVGIVVSSLFKLGPFLTLFLLLRKTFVTAFTTSAMIGVYGGGGIALALSSAIQAAITIPALAIFAAMATFYSQNRQNFEKRDKIIYIIFCCVIFTIFCGYVIFEGFITTTFMKWLAFKVT